jgi:hypothetical protein
MQSKLPLLHSCPGGVRKSTFRGPWRDETTRGASSVQVPSSKRERFRLFGRKCAKGNLRCPNRAASWNETLKDFEESTDLHARKCKRYVAIGSIAASVCRRASANIGLTSVSKAVRSSRSAITTSF